MPGVHCTHVRTSSSTGDSNISTMLCETSRTRAYHADLTWRMVYQWKVLDYPVKTVSENLCVDTSTVRRTLKFDTTGTVEKNMYPR